MKQEKRTRALVAKLELFAKLSIEDKEFLESSAINVREYSAGSDILREGQRADFLPLLITGWAGRYKTIGDSRCITALMIPGDVCDLHMMLLNQLDYSVGALSACVVAVMSRERITAMSENHKKVHRALCWSTIVAQSVLGEWHASLALRPARTRVAHLICEMFVRSHSVGLNEDEGFYLPLTQVQLADALGMTPIHMNRTLQSLRRSGSVSFSSHRMRVTNFDKLATEAGFNPGYLHL